MCYPHWHCSSSGTCPGRSTPERQTGRHTVVTGNASDGTKGTTNLTQARVIICTIGGSVLVTPADMYPPTPPSTIFSVTCHVRARRTPNCWVVTCKLHLWAIRQEGPVPPIWIVSATVVACIRGDENDEKLKAVQGHAHISWWIALPVPTQAIVRVCKVISRV